MWLKELTKHISGAATSKERGDKNRHQVSGVLFRNIQAPFDSPTYRHIRCPLNFSPDSGAHGDLLDIESLPVDPCVVPSRYATTLYYGMQSEPSPRVYKMLFPVPEGVMEAAAVAAAKDALLSLHRLTFAAPSAPAVDRLR